jgi:hypothetical protein
MRQNQKTVVQAGFVTFCVMASALPSARGQTMDALIVQGQPIPAIYQVQSVGPPGNMFSISSAAFASGNVLPPAIVNAIQWTDPQQPPPNVNPPIYFYQFGDPQGTVDVPQLQIGNLFGAMGFIDGLIDLNQPPGMATFNVPPQTPPGNVPNDPIQRAASLGAPQPFQNTIVYHDPQAIPNGLRNTIIVGLALPGTITTTRGIVTYGAADAQTEPANPNTQGGNGEFAWATAPAMTDPCIDESLVTKEKLEYLSQQEFLHGVTISSETEVVNSQTVRDRIVSYTTADDGFTYVTVVENHVTTAFYRFPTGTADPKGVVPVAGDFDNDNDVDGADFLSWQSGNSPNPNSPSDLARWKANFGAIIAGAPAVIGAPEPAAATIMLLGTLVLGFRRNKSSAWGRQRLQGAREG